MAVGNILILGDFEELHDRIAGCNDGFNEKVALIERSKARAPAAAISIGISRYNFGRLHLIAQMIAGSLGDNRDFSGLELQLFPVKDIAAHFLDYLEKLKQRVGGLNIEFLYQDDKLMEILNKIGLHSEVNPGREKELLRLLGVISEQAFLGPQTIVFDPYHRCNTKCQHCWVHTPGVHHPQEFLDRKFDFDIFKGIIDDASEMKTDGIILQGDGEPLMYDKFMPMLRYARQKGLGVMFFTNGILLDRQIAREVIDLGVDEIYCSFPAGSAQTYGKISTVQPGETFFRVWNNLKEFMRLKREAGKDKPRLIVSHVIHTLNHHELVEMAQMDADIAPDAVRFYLIRLDHMNRFLQLSPAEMEAIRKQVPRAEEILRGKKIELVDNFAFQLGHYDEKTGAWSKDFFLKHGCTIGWYFNLIPAKYDMSFCCHLRTVGYLDRQRFRDVWNSRDYWRWRRQAKYLKDNTQAKFANGQVLYDEHCDHCDNHQTIIRTLNELKKYDLYQYY